MATEYVLGIIAAAGTVVTSIFGGGMFSRYIKHSNDLAVARHIVDATTLAVEKLQEQVAVLKSDSAVISSKIEEFNKHVVKLDLIPDLMAKLDAALSTMQNMQDIVTALSKERRHHRAE